MRRRYGWGFVRGVVVWLSLVVLLWVHALCAAEGVWRVFGRPDGLSEGAAVSLSLSPAGTLWVQHVEPLGVTGLDGWSARRVSSGARGRSTVYESRTGQLWALDRNGLYELRRDEWLRHSFEVLRDVREGGEGGGWTGTPMVPVERNNVLVLLPDALVKLDV
ncbi:MAG: hypothetical protein RI897_4097, partial [Verrucomicrobiota bacterium]